MKRSPLERHTALARGAVRLTRRTPLARTSARLDRQPSDLTGDARKPAQDVPQRTTGRSGARDIGKAADWTQAVRDALASRNGGYCERCGQQPGTDPHHRKRRREGDHRVVNGAWLCRPCHRDVHERPAESRDHGFIVSAWSDPATAPLLVNGNRWALLTAEGGYRTDQRGWPT